MHTMHTLSLRTFAALGALTERNHDSGFYEGYRIRSLRPYSTVFGTTYVVTLDVGEVSADVHLPDSTLISVRHAMPDDRTYDGADS